tara:strand:+ start:2476 stop:3531 length:1056 start_codon:yes stop_codon:yes gene_type:complete
MSILVTGSAGFIGYHLCKKLLSENYEVFGLDNINNYYDVNLKKERIKDLKSYSKKYKFRFNFIKGDLTNNNDLERVFHYSKESNSNNCPSNIEIVINLAAQAGVRFSIENPNAYVQSNLVGFCNLIEKCKENNVKHFIYASSSSVYGGNKKLPFEETDSVDHPISLYAATKKSNELIAHTYSHLFKLPTTGLRFFTVYGPWGRPDMALFKFTDSIIKNKPIRVFNYGKMTRDFTYIKDVIDSISVLIKKSPVEEKYNSKISYNPSNSWAPYRVFNIGNSNPICLNDYIKAIEKNLNKKAEIILEEMQPGDVQSTFASTNLLEEWINFKPKTSINDGIKKFIDWYLSYYNNS